MSDLDTILTYLDAGEKERDYSIIGSMTPGDAAGRCVYCSHCHPCPQGIDIGLVNKYYDLAVIGDSMIKSSKRLIEQRKINIICRIIRLDRISYAYPGIIAGFCL